LKIFKKAGIEGTKVWSTGVVMVDLNGDLLDIYVCNAGNMRQSKKTNCSSIMATILF
jgi:hypothetical protein